MWRNNRESAGDVDDLLDFAVFRWSSERLPVCEALVMRAVAAGNLRDSKTPRSSPWRFRSPRRFSWISTRPAISAGLKLTASYADSSSRRTGF